MNSFTDSQVKMACRANLFDYLTKISHDDVTHAGDSLRLLKNHSVSVKRGYSGYTDFGIGETGNSVDFLGYSVPEAMLALCGEGYDTIREHSEIKADAEQDREHDRTLQLPAMVEGPFKYLCSYLQYRGITIDVIKELVGRGLLYEKSYARHHIC